MRTCPCCTETKPFSDFNKHRTRGVQTYCRACAAAKHQAGYGPVKARAATLKKEYGITLAQYDEMAVRQGGRCAICGRVDGRRPGEPLFVDHDHATDEVRGLLCHYCNLGLGAFMDTPALLLKAVEYLDETLTARAALNAGGSSDVVDGEVVVD